MMSQWFVGGPGKAIVTNDFRVGGNYENKMILATEGDTHQGCGTPGGPNAYIHSGQYLEIIPPEKIVFTWNSHLVADSRVTIELRDCGDTTDLTLTHELLETEELRQKHTGGWNHCLTNLANYLG